MNRIEMIRLVEELNNSGWSPLANDASDEYWIRLEIAREKKLEETIKNAPPEWLSVAIDLLLNYPTQREENSAFPRSPAVSGRKWSVRITKGRKFAAQESIPPEVLPDADAPAFVTPAAEEHWLMSLTTLLDVWAKYAPEQVIAALAPIVEKHSKQLAYGCGVAVETEQAGALPILIAGVADFESMDDDGIATLLEAVVSMSGVEAERLLEELKQKIFALQTIGSETAEILKIFNIRKNQHS
ncbi:MAG: hypothetical protein V4671_01750 [Armatimonadota bacterium]